MIMTVYSLLKPLDMPIKFLERPDFGQNKMCVSYHFFNQGDMEFGDGNPTKKGGSLQVDVYSKKVDYTSIVSDIKNILSNANFMLFDKRDDLENLSNSEQIYHKILIFNYVESEVIE
ncbi:MAG TPA: hypothetical protein GX731_02755 [Clostridiales bacterium]|nr:hypothetical protein [Clostridiales bacterium]